MQIYAEFHRISNFNLKSTSAAVLHRHAPHLKSLFRKKAARTGKVDEVLGQLSRIYDLHFSMADKDTIVDLGLSLVKGAVCKI